jgi:hypothetical protein
MHMNRWTVEAAHPRHVNVIANGMRAIDVIECRAQGRTPKQSLRLGLKASTPCLTFLCDGVPAAMMGVAPTSLIEGRGTVWMLGTDALDRSHRAILRLAPPILTAIERETPRLENIIAVENRRSAAWLRRLGFAFDEEILYVGGVAFRRFSRGF